MKYTKIVKCNQPPETLDPETIYVNQDDDGFAWLVTFLCPCQCGEEVNLNLIADEHPRWQMNEETVSITPSVLRRIGCKSHFWVKNGEVQFV